MAHGSLAFDPRLRPLIFPGKIRLGSDAEKFYSTSPVFVHDER